jgi:hypothetical protein
MTRFERRVRQLEARAGAGRATIPAECEFWIELKDGGMLGEDGEIISRKAFEQRRSNARAILVLPDNGRDPDLINQLRLRSTNPRSTPPAPPERTKRRS